MASGWFRGVSECNNALPPGHVVMKTCSGPSQKTVREDDDGQACWTEFIILPSLTLSPFYEDLNNNDNQIQLISKRSDRPCNRRESVSGKEE